MFSLKVESKKLRFEKCNVNTSTKELLALGRINMKMWYLFEWLDNHQQLRHGTQAEIIKLYVEGELAAYTLLENYEARSDKQKIYQGELYQDLGVVHFVTVPKYRNNGYASLLADRMFVDIIQPLLARYSSIHAYITATGRAVPLMQRTAIDASNLVIQFYSDLTFEEKVVKQLQLIPKRP